MFCLKSELASITEVILKQMEDQHKELEEQREMATNRLAELDRLHQNHRDVLQQLEHLKMDVIPLNFPYDLLKFTKQFSFMF